MRIGMGLPRALAALGAAALALPAAAGADVHTVNDDNEGPGPAGATCEAPDFGAIEAAIDAAAAGDRVLVCAGTYVEPDDQLLVDKSVEIVGAGPGSTIVDGRHSLDLPSFGTIRVEPSADGDVLLQGFTLRNPGVTEPLDHFFNGVRPIQIGGDDRGAVYELADVEIEADAAHYGVIYGGAADFVLRDSVISDVSQRAVVVENATGAVEVAGNEIDCPSRTSCGTAIEIGAYDFSNTLNPVRIAGNEITAPFAPHGILVAVGEHDTAARLGGVTIEGNEIAGPSQAITLSNGNPTTGGLTGEIAAAAVVGNRVREADLVETVGIELRGAVSGATVLGNDLGEAEPGIRLVANATGAPGGLRAAFNRMPPAGLGVENPTAQDVDAENNWWGCNEGPGAAGCAAVQSPMGETDAEPWLVLGLTADPARIETGGDAAQVTASLRANSAGAGALGPFPELEVAFATDLGAIAPGVAPLEEQLAQATLTSGKRGGPATVAATLDNETARTRVEIRPFPGACANETRGTARADRLRGGAAGDALFGLGGKDTLRGGAGKDCLDGGGGADKLFGDAGRDKLAGGGGRDRLVGGAGADVMRGGGGNDRLVARGGGRDKVACGPGRRDVAIVDRRDRVRRDCEIVRVR